MMPLGPRARALVDALRDVEDAQEIPGSVRAQVTAGLIRRGCLDTAEPSPRSIGGAGRLVDRLRFAVAAAAALAVGGGVPAWATVGLWFAVGAGTSLVAVYPAYHPHDSVRETSGPAIHATPPSSAPAVGGDPARGRDLGPPNQPPPRPPKSIPSAEVALGLTPGPATNAIPMGSPLEDRRLGSALPARVESPSPSAESTLADEAALLTEVQQSLRGHDPHRTFALLDEYDARFPRGTLAIEARAARVVATCELQDREMGRRMALEFDRSWPTSPLRARIAAACSGSPPPRRSP